jgi:hypothetical protein
VQKKNPKWSSSSATDFYVGMVLILCALTLVGISGYLVGGQLWTRTFDLSDTLYAIAFSVMLACPCLLLAGEFIRYEEDEN